MDAANVEQLQAEGWPWDRLAEAIFARQEAARRAELVAEDPAATVHDREWAAYLLTGALAAEDDERDKLAAIFLLLLQAAIDKRPQVLFGKVMAAAEEVYWKDVLAWLASSKPGGAEQWLALSRHLAR